MSEVSQIVSELTAASDLYYNGGDSPLSDSEYDALEARLRQLDPANPYFLTVGSDTRGDKVPLPVSMGSLDQVHEGDTVRWIKGEGLSKVNIVVTDKLDGNSVLLVYSDSGDLHVAYTRGNGTHGQDVTRHVKRFLGVPLRGVIGARFVVAEVIMKDTVFQNIKKYIEQDTGKEYKNPRNFVAGQMNSSEASQYFYDNVDVVAFGIRDSHLIKSDQIQHLKALGFDVPGWSVYAGQDLNDPMLTDHLAARHKESEWALDGVVLDVDDTVVADRLRAKKRGSSLNPAESRKFKVGQDDNVAVSEVVQVHWNVSKDGYLKPRVEIQPVDLVGVTVTYATGFNARFIVDSGIGPGAQIIITRSGDVIPFIKGVVEPVEPQLPDPDEIGSFQWTEKNAEGKQVDLILTDVHGSDDVKRRQLRHFIESMEFEFINKKGIEKLAAAGYDRPEDFITITESDLARVIGDGMARKVVAVRDQIMSAVPAWKLAGSHPAFGRGVGRRKLKKVQEFWGQCLDLSVDKLVIVEGIEEKTAQKIFHGYADFGRFLKAIDGHYAWATEDTAAPTGDSMADQVVVFTGVRDKDLEQKVVDQGGKIGSGVNSRTTILVCKDPSAGSSKLKKAAEMGVRIVGIDEFRVEMS